MAIQIGCQVNCWPLGSDFGVGFVQAVREAGEIGYAGFEVNWRMTLTWRDREDELRDILDAAGIRLSALFFGAGSAEATAARQEIDDALACAAFLQRFGASAMMIGGGKATDDKATFRAVCEHYSELGRRTLGDYGVKACYHPHHGAIACTPDEIDRMMEWTDPEAWFLCPDTGILAKDGHDLPALIRRYAERIPTIHFKDWDGGDGWTMLGRGVIDHSALVRILNEIGYDGWIISENESRQAGFTPRQLQAADRRWLRDQGL